MDPETITDQTAQHGAGSLLAQLDRVLEEAGIYLASEVRDGAVILSGEVESDASRQAALDVASALAEPAGLTVEDAIEVMETAPDTGFLADAAAGGGEFGYVDPDIDHDDRLDPGFELEPDFTGRIGTTDSEESAAEATPYFPPTDPVVRPTGDDQTLAVVGGFGATAMDDETGGASFDARNDDDITQDVVRELREDALTIDLVVHVSTRAGVVTLRGEVPTLDDAENAEAVASRIPGVLEVREDLTITGMERS